MARWCQARRGAAVGVVALTATLAVVPCAAAVASDAGATASPTPSATPTPSSTPSPSSTRPPATPGPSGSATVPSVPSDAEVARAQDAAAAAAREVADITARVELAGARLEALQRAVAEAVTAQEQAEQQLADAEASVHRAGDRLSAARRTREQSDRALSGIAALIYMQGGDLQNLTSLLLTPPNAMSDLAVVLDGTARQARESLDAASAAAADAAAEERLLVAARDSRDAAAREASAKRTAAEQEAAKAGAEAARLGEEQESLVARLVELDRAAADLAGRREGAALLGGTDLLGLQAADGSGPRAAQAIARATMAEHGWNAGEFGCLLSLWTAESGWSWSATNPSSGAYGIPQALPGWKIASAGSDWLTNPATQITWGLDYIESVYGSPCEAYARFLARSPHWY